MVVGGGISGLSAAYFYRAARPNAQILILDNHDDFGGHAKRNEFHLGGKLQLLNGGTLEIDSPRPYSAVADGLLKTLGIDPPALSKACDQAGALCRPRHAPRRLLRQGDLRRRPAGRRRAGPQGRRDRRRLDRVRRHARR